MTNQLRHILPVFSRAGIVRKWSRLLYGILPALLVIGLIGFSPSTLKAQVTATLSGTVTDPSGSVIPGAAVILTNEATRQVISVTTNGAGLYAFPSLVPGTYTIKASAKGFKNKEITGIVLNGGDNRTIPVLALAVGAASETVTVSATSEMIPISGGQRTDVLSTQDIKNIPLETRDVTALLEILPGAVTTSAGLTQTASTYASGNQEVTVDQSTIGDGLYIDGSIYRGGTTVLEDGAQMIDIGNMGQSLTVIDPTMTASVTTEASNADATVPFGPVIVSAISKSGSDQYHGEAYFDARNNVLDANGWQQNNSGTPLGPAHYYYPGVDGGGPVPFTHKHLLFWGGWEKWIQNLGNQSTLTSFIPSPEMMQGDFSMDNADNQLLCPDGFFQGAPPGGYPGGSWCSDLGGNTVLANGTSTAALPAVTEGPGGAGTSPTTVTIGTTNYTADYGQKFPAGYIDPGSAALAKIWPAANFNPLTASGQVNTCGGCNYYEPIVATANGWIYRARLDYKLGDNTLIYGSYQQAYAENLAQNNGAHLYWTPGNAIPYPGGGVEEADYGKTLAGHIVHTFNATTTNDFMAAWAFGSFPFVVPTPSAAYKSTLGYPYGKVFSTSSLNIPAYSSAGNETFPDFSQASIFENPPGSYGVKKEAPQFGDTFTKVWGKHTVKIGGFTQTTDNWQSDDGSYLDGNASFYSGQNPDAYNTGNKSIGSQYNATAMFVSGIMSGYSENSLAPITDVAEQNTAAFVEDSWKTTSHLTVNLGIRMEHVGHWYDRDHIGVAVFEPNKVLTDYEAGKYAPGFEWHAIDPGVPLSGQPNRFAYPDARFGMSYDLFGNGNTVVRGGWGVYRYVTQVNTIAGEMSTSQEVLGYSSPGGHNLQMQNIHDEAYSPCPNPATGLAPPCGVQGGQSGLDATDYGQPMTESYNFTIDQRLPWNTHFEIAYVGNSTSQLVNDGEDTEGSNFSELADVNKTPIGGLFLPDPVTGVISTNPENVTENPNLSTDTETPTHNTDADYHPYGYAYGTNSVQELENDSYANYNGLQASWIKTTGKLGFDLNASWSKMLGTTLQANSYNIKDDYGPTAQDRPFVFNASYMYQSGKFHQFGTIGDQLLGGWTIAGISTWQAGTYFPAELGNGVPNFGMGQQYINLPADTLGATGNLTTDTGVSNGLGGATYFGTDNGNLYILPQLTCNPTSNLASHQVLNGACFTLPPIGTQGGQNFPYMRMTAYFDNDLALYRTFTVHNQQNVQIKASAFDWLNHSLLEFASGSQYTLNYNVDYATHAITPNFNNTSTGTNAFGVMTVRSQLPYARIIELEATYNF